MWNSSKEHLPPTRTDDRVALAAHVELLGDHVKAEVAALDLREIVQTQGYVLLDGIGLSRAAEVATMFGEITTDMRSPDVFRRISPQSLDDAKPNTLSSRYGLGSFPFHTDVAHWKTPAEFVLLFCDDPGSGSRPTKLVDTRQWQITPRLRHSLLSSLWKTGHRSPRFCTVGREVDQDLGFRYDTGCMKPAGRESAELHEKLENLISSARKVQVSWEANFLLIIDNRRMLHARGIAAAPDKDRKLVRMLIGGHQ